MNDPKRTVAVKIGKNTENAIVRPCWSGQGEPGLSIALGASGEDGEDITINGIPCYAWGWWHYRQKFGPDSNGRCWYSAGCSIKRKDRTFPDDATDAARRALFDAMTEARDTAGIDWMLWACAVSKRESLLDDVSRARKALEEAEDRLAKHTIPEKPAT